MTHRTDASNENSTVKEKEYVIISQVAYMYYVQNMLQPEIAKKLFFSRSKVSRLLKQSRELNLVEIKVKRILNRVEPIEKKLCETFNLQEAVVVSSFDDDSDVLNTLTDFAALYVSKLLKGDCILGITNGHTINRLVEKLQKLHECNIKVLQLMGSASNTHISLESMDLVNRVAATFSGTGHFLNTPLYIDDLYAKNILLRDRAVQEVFDLMQQCNIILTGIGGMRDASEYNTDGYGYKKQKHIDELIAKNAVGSICAQYFDVDGQYINCEWNAKCIAMPFDSLLKNNMTIGIAAGKSKTLPILGALRGRVIDVLITDANTASDVLTRNEKQASIAQRG